MTENIFDKHLFDFGFWHFSSAHVPSANMEEARCITYTAASHQGAIEMIRLHIFVAVCCKEKANNRRGDKMK